MNEKLGEHGQPPAHFHQKDREKRSCAEMIGICKGIIADGKVCEAEAKFLINWCEANPDAAVGGLGQELFRRLEKIWADGQATEDELKDLHHWIGQATGMVCPAAAEVPVNFATQAFFDDPEPEVEIKGRTFCFTGKPADGAPRKEYEQRVKDRGGKVAPRVLVDLDYLVVCAIASKDWKQSNFGTKIEKALAYKKQGWPIKIISEQCWLRGSNK